MMMMNPTTTAEQALLKSAIELCLQTIEAEKRTEPFKKTLVDCEANFALERAKQAVQKTFEAILNTQAEPQGQMRQAA